MRVRKQEKITRKNRALQCTKTYLLFAFCFFFAISAWLPCLALSKQPARASIGKAAAKAFEKSKFSMSNPDNVSGKVVLIFMDRVGLEDILEAKTPNIHHIAEKGSSGLMNVRVRNDIYGGANYLIIGAGGRAIAGEGAGFAFEAREALLSRSGTNLYASNIFQSRTGLSVRRDSILHLYIEDMKRRSESIKGGGVPGILGETLKKADKKVSLVGNADSLVFPGAVATIAEPSILPEASIVGYQPGSLFSYVCHREAACAAIDRQGIVPSGKVSTELVILNMRTGNASTNFEKLLSAFVSEYSKSDFIIVDLGETSRVDENARLFSDEQIKRKRAAAIGNCDRTIGKIMNSCDLSRDLIIICAPTPSRKMISQTELITPVFIYGPGFEKGALTSATTKTKGLITNMDIAPTVLSFFGIEIPPEIEGKPAKNITVSNTEKFLESLLRMKNRAVFVARSRTTLFKAYVIPAIFIFLICAVLSIIRKDLIIQHEVFWSIIFLAVLAGPTAFSLITALPVNSLWFSIPAAIGAQVLLALTAYCVFIFGSRKVRDRATKSMKLRLLSRKRTGKQKATGENDLIGGKADASQDRTHGGEKTPVNAESKCRHILPRAVLFVSALTLFMVLIDPLIGTPFGSSSPFGALIVLGGRFYGIGNLFMGLAVGSAITISTLLRSTEVKSKTDIIPGKTPDFSQLIFALLTLTITLVVLGHASLGANVGGVITAGFAGIVSVLTLSGRKLNWKILLMASVAVAIILSILIIVDVFVGGASSHAGTFVSKFLGGEPGEAFRILGRKMIMNYTIMLNSLWRFFVLAGLFALFVWNRKFAIFKRCFYRFPATRSTLAGMTTAFFISLIFNDTGIEPASAILLFLASIFFLLSMPLTPEAD